MNFFVRVESSDHDNFFSPSVLFVYNIPYILLLSFSFIFDVFHCTTMTNHILFLHQGHDDNDGKEYIRFDFPTTPANVFQRQ